MAAYRGRPMRSLQNMSGLAARQLSLPPLLLEEPSENEPSENAGAGALQLLGRRPEDAGADAGSALAENAAAWNDDAEQAAILER